MSDSYKIYASKDYVDSKGLPDGQAAHQQLVTDAEGVAKWEDKAFGEKTTKFFLVEESAVAYILQSGDLWIGSVSNLTPPITYNASVRYVITINGVDYDAIVFDSQHLDVIVALPDVPTASGGKGHRVRIAGNNGNIVVYDCMENTELELVVSVSSLMHEIKTIDPKYLPTTVPVIQSAQVGQTIIVKSVDENGKPTAWETIDPWVITSPNGTQFKLTIDDEGILSAAELV